MTGSTPGTQQVDRTQQAEALVRGWIAAWRDDSASGLRGVLHAATGEEIVDLIERVGAALRDATERGGYDALYTAALAFCHSIEVKLKRARGSRKEIELARAVRAITVLRANQTEPAEPTHV